MLLRQARSLAFEGLQDVRKAQVRWLIGEQRFLVLLIDEIDALASTTLISTSRQL